ncbi:fumarylacetoacetate hydrolase family protein [Parafrigoribacterium mesophilum]|uniref:fumarylacetoacetate hydrolase family protein n=1 Tax=Parafrigoribacterium mesophilum TaxID=433646 RepID=UPI0031FDC515
MYLLRLEGGRIAVEREDEIFALPVRSLAELLAHSLAEIRTLVTQASMPTADGKRLAPIDGRTEVWASGVTYQRSRTARMDESTDPDIYDRVYAATRPELFFKAPAWRVVTHGDPVAIRDDSTWDVPEPELAVIANRFGEIVGYGACNDMSSRSLEGENPLYLPQAKVFAGACALGPTIRPAWEVDPATVPIRLTIEREGRTVLDESTSTAALVRKVPDLVAALFHAENFPDGAWLSTGTGIVPPNDFTLCVGDTVTVDILGVATTTNTVASGRDAWLFLTER